MLGSRVLLLDSTAEHTIMVKLRFLYVPDVKVPDRQILVVAHLSELVTQFPR